MDEHRLLLEVLGSLGRRDDERVGAIDGVVHVEHAEERAAHHPRVEVVLHRQRRTQRGVVVERRARAAVDRDVAQVLALGVVLVEVAVGPGGVRRAEVDVVDPRADRPRGRQLHRAPPTEGIRGGRLALHRRDGVVDENRLALAGVDGVHRGDDLLRERREGVVEVGDLGDAQRALHKVRRQHRPDDPVDVVAGDTGVVHGVLAGLDDEGEVGLAGVARERTGADASEGDLVTHREAGGHQAAPPIGRKAGSGLPLRSTQVSSTGVPMRRSSFSTPTTVALMRRPGCSTNSMTATGCPAR